MHSTVVIIFANVTNINKQRYTLDQINIDSLIIMLLCNKNNKKASLPWSCCNLNCMKLLGPVNWNLNTFLEQGVPRNMTELMNNFERILSYTVLDTGCPTKHYS